MPGLLGPLVALAMGTSVAGVAEAQDTVRAPTADRPERRLALPQGLTGADPPPATASRAPGGTAPNSPTTGSVPRAGFRSRVGRRTRAPASLPVQTSFRSTLAPSGIAVNTQPVQVGVPDAEPSVVPALRRRLATPPLLVNNSLVPAPPALDALTGRALADDGYSPVPLRAGNVYVLPVLGQSVGYDTNPNRAARGVRPSVVSRTEGEVAVQSDWSRHELSGFLRGAYNDYPNNKASNRPDGLGRLALRIDATRDLQLDAEGHFLVDTQRPGSPDLNVVVRARPIYYTEGASVGASQRFNRLLVGLRGTIDRTDYENAQLSNGTIVDQRDRALTAYGLRGRIGYELKPGLIPFAEVIADTREYDRRVDSAGFQRSSDGISAKVGTTFEIGRLLTAEASAGVTARSYQDPRLGDLTSPIADLALTYLLSPITTIRATAVADVIETTIPNANGIRSVRGGIELVHSLRRNLTFTAGLTAGDYSYQGVRIQEQAYGGLARLDWRLNRNMAVRASYNYDTIRSTVAGSSFATHAFLVGLRLTP